MKIIGIVAEYNPFHNGHAFHLHQTRQIADEECTIIVVMSGDFVQRGEAAVFSKYLRAETACFYGADLVVELPSRWALQSAEKYANDAVSLLYRMGAESLSFGCEEQDLQTIEDVADLFLQKDFYSLTSAILKDSPNLNFPAARQAAAEKLLQHSVPGLKMANTILAVEYLKAIKRNHFKMDRILIPRIGPGHDSSEDSCYMSASAIRSKIWAGEDYSYSVPKSAFAAYREETMSGRLISNQKELDSAILSRLQMLNQDDFRRIPDASENLCNQFAKALRTCTTYDELWHTVSSKRYPASRIRRISLNASLGFFDYGEETEIPFARVLAFNEKGRSLLGQIKKYAAVPLLVRPGAVRDCSAFIQNCFHENSKAHDFLAFGFTADARPRPGEDWRKTAQFVKQ